MWQADQYFIGGGNLYTSDSIQGTTDLGLFRPARYGLYSDFSYQFTVPNGSYRVRLRFAEIQYYAAGYRTFHVDLNGSRVLPNFDIAQAAGGGRRAIDREFTANVTNGQIRLDFVGVLRRGLINAIEITANGPASPTMTVAPAALSFAAVAGAANPAAQGVNVSITGGTLAWTAASNRTWLSIAPAGGSASATVTASVNTTGLAAGVHTGAITFTANGVPQTVSVTLTLTPPPSLSVSPLSLNFAANLGSANPAAQVLSITVSNGPLPWTAASNQPWLTVSPSSGSATASLAVAANIAALTAGTYNATIAVNSAAGANNIPVTLVVTAVPSLSVAPGTMSFTGQIGGTNPSAQPATVTIANGSAAWNAVSNQSWLLVSPASGSGSGALSVSANLGSLAAGTYTGAITVTSAGVAGSPATINVTFVVSAAPGSAQPIRINSGGPSYSGPAGTFQADTYFAGGANYYTSDGITGTADLQLYRAARYSLYTDFTYQIPVPNGSYAVKLRFAELQYTTVGARRFHVDLNGTRVLENFDITQQAGGARRVLDREFAVSVTGGVVRLDFVGVVQRGMVNAIEVIPAAPPAMLSVLPASLTFGGPGTQQVAVTSSVNWSATSNQSWLTLSPTTGASGNANVTVGVLPPGMHTGAITFTAGSATQTLSVTVNVPSLTVAPTSLTFTGPGSQQAAVTSSVNWSATSNQSWLTTSPTTGPSGNVTVTVAALAPGTHTGAITFTAGSATQTLSVTVNVPSLTVAPTSLTFTGPGSQQVAVTSSVNW